LALGEESGQFTLHVPFYRSFPFDGLASIDRTEAMSFLNERWLARFDGRKLTCKSFDVSVRRLDELGLAPDVVKIDVQGLETDVIKGGIETFRRHRPVTIIEMPPPELIDILGELDLHPYYFDGKRLQPFRRQWKNALFLTPDQVARSGVERVS
jgi:FkbM family methyltransferase